MRLTILLACLCALLFVACGGNEPVPPPEGIPAHEGYQLFTGRFNCDSCHPGGQKGVGPALVGETFRQHHPMDATIIRQVRNGGGGMPDFPPDVMTDEQLQDIVAYLRWLNEQDMK